MIYNLIRRSKGGFSPQVRPPLCPNNKCETQTLWPQPDTKQIKFCYGALTSPSPSSPHQQNQFWKDSTRCFVRNGQSEKWIDANLLMCLFVFVCCVCVGVCLCFFLFRGGFEQDVENGYHQLPDTCHGEMETHFYSQCFTKAIKEEREKTPIDYYQILMAERQQAQVIADLTNYNGALRCIYFNEGSNSVHVEGAWRVVCPPPFSIPAGILFSIFLC